MFSCGRRTSSFGCLTSPLRQGSITDRKTASNAQTQTPHFLFSGRSGGSDHWKVKSEKDQTGPAKTTGRNRLHHAADADRAEQEHSGSRFTRRNPRQKSKQVQKGRPETGTWRKSSGAGAQKTGRRAKVPVVTGVGRRPGLCCCDRQPNKIHAQSRRACWFYRVREDGWLKKASGLYVTQLAQPHAC